MGHTGTHTQGALMNIVFLSRKRRADIGGLARFAAELTARFPATDWRLPIDHIHATDATLLPFGVFLKLLFKVPLTVTAHGKDICWPNPIYQRIFSLCAPFVSVWVVDSQTAAELLKRKGVKTIRVIAPGISLDHFKKQASRTFSAPTGKIVLLTVGNLVPRKGHAWFIRHILTKLPSRFIYSIVGEGKERNRIVRLTKQYRLEHRVFLLGRLTDERLAELLTRIHMYIAPNRHIPGDFEGFGIAAGEAAAMGLPVIAHAVDGLPGIIRHQNNGILIPPTIHAWRKALSTLTPEKRMLLGKQAKRYTRTRFSWNTTISAYRRVFQEVIRKTRRSPARTAAT